MSGGPDRYLVYRLAVIDARVRVAVEAFRRRDADPDDRFRGMYVSAEQATELASGERRSVGEVLARWDPATEMGVEPGTDAPLIRLRNAAGLDDSEIDVLVAALAPDVDDRFERLYGYLHDDLTRRRLSIGLGIELACRSPLDPDVRARLSPGSALVRLGLVEIVDPERPFLSRELSVPDRVTEQLLGGGGLDAGLVGLVDRPPLLEDRRLDDLVSGLARRGTHAHVVAPEHALAVDAIDAAVCAAGRVSLIVDPRRAPVTAQPGTIVRSALREAALRDAVLVIGPVDEAVAAEVRLGVRPPVTVVTHGPRRVAPPVAAEATLERTLTAVADGEDRWRQAADRTGLVLDARLLGPYRLSSGQVETAIGVAAGSRCDRAPTTAEVLEAARRQNGLGLERLATRIHPTAGLGDLVVDQRCRSELGHLIDRVRTRGTIRRCWGVGRGSGRSVGVAALFAGDSGTGKTYAAEAVAGELGLDLYVIDLSTVVDKYIGETEKNLERLFAEAEGINGVLFFDEADALFGKRSEVSDSKDRFANVEVAFLLQRMERFDGLAVLATNLRSNLDEAFARRLSVVVEFRKPDRDERRELWRRTFSTLPGAEELDLEFCADAFELTGANIADIGVTAASLVAARGSSIHMADLVRATQLELRKLGRLSHPEDFGPYYRHLREPVG